MSNEDRNDQHGQQEHLQHGSWQPTPQGGEYDADATAFVHLPPEDLANIPLAAPGQGYVPPMILPLTPAAGLDPSATGSWVVQTQGGQEHGTGAERPAPGAVHWPDPNQQQGPYDYEYEYPQTPHASQVPQASHDAYPQQQYGETQGVATGQWNFTESTEYGVHTGQVDHTGQTGHAGQVDHAGRTGHAGQVDHVDHAAHIDHASHTTQGGHTGQWTIPVADGDLPEESGEFAASALAAQWYGDRTPPATLPGGAPAPWATQQPTPEPEPAPEPEPEAVPEPVAEVVSEAEEASAPVEAPAPEEAPATPSDNASASDEAPSEHQTEPEPEPAADPEPHAADRTPEPDVPQPVVADEAAAAPPADTAPPEAQASDTGSSDAEPPDAPPAADLQPADDARPDAAVQPTDPQPDADPQPLALPDEHPAASYVLHVNGTDRPVTDAWIGESLLYVLRERLGLAGAKDGCSQGECGACNVQVDGRLVASCLVPAATAAGSEVRTVEGLAVDGEPSDVQRALAKCGAVQCGFCIPGMAMTVHDLLEGNHAPSELETRQALCGNLCRCSGYRGVLDAVNEVIAGREATIDPASSDSTSPEPDEARIPHQAAPGAGSVQSHPQDGGMA
ncbi:(2Fe-2S)-binding protein [Streptomyces sp. NPDC002403]